MDFKNDLGTEVITEYYDESDYVSSVEHYTPFPSLTLSKKVILECYLHNGQVVSTFSNANIEEPKIEQTESVTQESQQEIVKQESQHENENIGCCLLL